MFTANARCEGVNDSLTVGRPAESDRVEHVAFSRETKVFGCVASRIGIVKRPGGYLGWTFTINPPWPRAVDRLPIHVQPGADIKKNLLHLVRYGVADWRIRVFVSALARSDLGWLACLSELTSPSKTN